MAFSALAFIVPRVAFHGVFSLGCVPLNILETAVVAGFVSGILFFRNVC